MDAKLVIFSEALNSLEYLTTLDMQDLAIKLDSRLIDGLENGKAQKFEYALELCWKTIKHYLKKQEGIDELSPKKIIKAWYLTGHLLEDDYLTLIAAIDDRNKLSHVYDVQQFMIIIEHLPAYAMLMRRIVNELMQYNL